MCRACRLRINNTAVGFSAAGAAGGGPLCRPRTPAVALQSPQSTSPVTRPYIPVPFDSFRPQKNSLILPERVNFHFCRKKKKKRVSIYIFQHFPVIMDNRCVYLFVLCTQSLIYLYLKNNLYLDLGFVHLYLRLFLLLLCSLYLKRPKLQTVLTEKIGGFFLSLRQLVLCLWLCTFPAIIYMRFRCFAENFPLGCMALLHLPKD